VVDVFLTVENDPACSITRSSFKMCDYSLHNIASRPAKIADKLVTSKFAGTISRGFAAVGEPNVAVCLLPGTEIAFDREVKYGGFLFSSKTGQKTAVFRQINQHEPATYHDALEFADGQSPASLLEPLSARLQTVSAPSCFVDTLSEGVGERTYNDVDSGRSSYKASATSRRLSPLRAIPAIDRSTDWRVFN